MIGNAGEPFAQIGFGIEPVQLRGTDQAVERCRAFPASIRSGKQIVLATQGHVAQGPFGSIVIDLDLPIFYIAQQRIPTRER